MPCSWQKEDYFSLLMCTDKGAFTALEMLVDDLHADKERTVVQFLCHSGSEDFLWGLVRLLGNDTARVAGNAAYILGTLAESEIGCVRVLSLVKGNSKESKKILPDLTRMLTFNDSESVMNAAGTMGTLAESHEGRQWILGEKCLTQTIDHITALLNSDNLWTASNAALVLARLSISEYGCSKILEHEHSQHILSKLILSLGVDEAGRGMNAAFAIGRLCDLDQGRKCLLQLSDSERMISSLAKMLSCDDAGASKNACFALSCLATNSEGHSRLLNNIHSEEILRTLATLLSAQDSETGWFAAMTLRTLASQPKGCLRLRDHPQVVPSLKKIESKEDINSDLKEEAIVTLEILKRLPKPSPPIITVMSASVVKANWDTVTTKSGFPVRYQLFDGTKCVYTGKQCECEIYGLQANTTYIFKLRAYTEGDESPFSDAVSITTEEAVPGPPQSVRILGTTITQIKIGWDPPLESNGILKGYYVYLDDEEHQYSTENSLIITGLAANTSYVIEVCAATSKGKGEHCKIVGTTAELGAHAPSKPHVNVIGRNELYVSWTAPEVPLGRFNRYDVIMNNTVIYSGTDLNLPVRRLTPDTEYSFVVVALTSEGKFDSKMTKKRTAKDEYDQARPPLYQPPKKEVVEEGPRTPASNTTSTKRRKSAGRISSAKCPIRRSGTCKERSKSISGEQRPSSVSSNCTSLQETKPDIGDKPLSPLTTPYRETSPQPTLSTPVSKSVSEVRYQDPQFSVKQTKLNQLPKNIHHMNKPPLVAINTISAQNKLEKSEESKSLETPISCTKFGGKSDRDLNSAGVKIEKSKTVINERDWKIKNSSHTLRLETETTLTDDRGNGLKVRPITSERLNKSSHVTKLSGSKPDFSDGAKEMDKVALNKHERSSNVISDRVNSLEISKHGNEIAFCKDTALPKPLPPSHKYLGHQIHGDSLWDQRSAPSAKSSKDEALLDSDWLIQVKSTSAHNFTNPHIVLDHAESTYFINTPQFLQRTNTYISSHRPMGRRSLEKLQKSTSVGGKVISQGKISHQSVNVEFDGPENTTKLGNKFVPMQLRTQPSNLGIGQLQRVNTTLLGDLTENSVSFRRVEAMTRSHTHIDMKVPHSHLPPDNRRDLGLVVTKDRERHVSAHKSLGSSLHSKAHKLGGSAALSHRNKEPDSVLLQQSWSQSSSHDIGAI